MVLINGSDFEIYDLDTQESVLNRLASQYKTIPKYLYFPDGIPKFNQETKNIKVIDLYGILIDKKIGIGFLKIYEDIKDKISQKNLDLYNDIILPYIALNPKFSDQNRDLYILSVENDIKNNNDIQKILGKKVNISSLKDYDLKIVADNIKKQIEQTKSFTAEYIKKINKFNSIKSPIKYTPFEVEKVDFEFSIDIKHVSIMEIFNSIVVNPYVPFVTINNFYKILKDFLPPSQWNISLEKAIVFKVLQKTDNVNVKPEDYSDTVLFITGDNPENEKIKVGMSLYTSGNYLSQEKFIERFLNVFKYQEIKKITDLSENKLNGIFYFPRHSLDKYVFADLIMNNPLFSSLLSVDESDKASKKKDSIYVYFYHPKVGNVTANILEKISEKGDQSIKGKDIKKDFEYGSRYIRVKVSSASNMESVNFFQETLGKLFVLYDNEYNDIVNFYKKFIPDFGNIIPYVMKVQVKTKLKDIAPEVFIHGYPPKCPNQPLIIEDDEVQEAENSGKIVMRYPKDDSLGVVPRNYVCNFPKAIYPGLRDNPLSNRDIVPFLPCCYTKDHRDKKGSIYRHYYYNEELKEKSDSEQQDFIITNKFVQKDKYGTLPKYVEKLFGILDYTEEYIYLRKGVYNSPNTFIECVMEGMYENTGILEYQDSDKRQAKISEIRKSLANETWASSCKQEMYDFTTKEIINMINDKNAYFDPKYFVSLLENYFKCNIYVFTRSQDNNGKMALPRYSQAYYKNVNRNKSVIIYEHMGSTSDNAKYPRCELVVKWKISAKSEDDVSYCFDYNSKISLGIRNVAEKIHKSYVLNTEILPIVFPINTKTIKLIEQGIDSYGKTRFVIFEYESNKGMFITTPIQPLVLKEAKEWNVLKLPINIAVKLCIALNIKITSRSVVKENNIDITKEIQGVLGNINITIPVEDITYKYIEKTIGKNIREIENIQVVPYSVKFTDKKFSLIDNYNKYKKLARYITEYIYWMFSMYIKNKKIKIENIDDPIIIKTFFMENIIVDKNFEYKNVEKKFSLSSGIMNKNKMVVKSDETLKRLIYSLRVFAKYNRNKLYNYHSRKVIENYYVDVTDFDKYQDQVILYGSNSVEKWIIEQKIKYQLYDSIRIDYYFPYFFQNNLIDDSIYLAQNTDDLYKAFEISRQWYEFGKNTINIDNLSDVDKIDLEFDLYRYINNKNIEKIHISGSNVSFNIKIIGYKVDGIPIYTVLLNL